jgi:hypothetical protein
MSRKGGGGGKGRGEDGESELLENARNIKNIKIKAARTEQALVPVLLHFNHLLPPISRGILYMLIINKLNSSIKIFCESRNANISFSSARKIWTLLYPIILGSTSDSFKF